MIFKRAEIGDAPLLYELEKLYIECGWSENIIRATVSDEYSQIFFAEEDGEVVGYGGCKTVGDFAEIYNIVVLPQFRRKGYGVAILSRLIDCAKVCGAEEMFLEVNENNTAAISLYGSNGFENISVRKNYYKSGNAVVMRLKINKQ